MFGPRRGVPCDRGAMLSVTTMTFSFEGQHDVAALNALHNKLFTSVSEVRGYTSLDAY
jgi:hypothetical protein